jgi:hypothetical protein
MIAADPALGKFSITARLFKLVGDMPKDQQLILLKQLVGDSVSAHLYKLIVEMTPKSSRSSFWNRCNSCRRRTCPKKW